MPAASDIIDIRVSLLCSSIDISSFLFFFFNDTATTEIYTLSLHDALPIFATDDDPRPADRRVALGPRPGGRDRKSTRLNSSHPSISYAVFCLKKKKTTSYQAPALQVRVKLTGHLELSHPT